MKIATEPPYQVAIIRRLALNHNKTYQEVFDIYYSQFKFVNRIIKSGTFEKVLLNSFCTFSVDTKRLKHLENNKSKKEKNESV